MSELLRDRFFMILTVVMGGVTCFVELVMRLIWPERYWPYYLMIPMFYYILGVITIVVLHSVREENDKKMLHYYMLMRAFKLVLTFVFIGSSMLVIHYHRMLFMILLMSFYFVYLILETYFYFHFEKEFKRRK